MVRGVKHYYSFGIKQLGGGPSIIGQFEGTPCNHILSLIIANRKNNSRHRAWQTDAVTGIRY